MHSSGVLDHLGFLHRSLVERSVGVMAGAGYRHIRRFHPDRHHVVVERDVPYGAAGARAPREHRLDVYIPTRAAKPLPVIMYVHGGGFTMLSKETHRIMALTLARRGYLVFNINYRLGPRHLYPAPLEDAAAALLWVNANAARYGGDLSRVVLAGESAGCNLVTALTVAHVYRRPEPFAASVYDANISLRGTIATYGFLDLADTARMITRARLPLWTKLVVRDAAICYLGRDVPAAAMSNPLASPLVLLERGEAPARPLPPFFISCGSRDPLLPQSKRLKAALERLGGRSDLVVYPGEIHGHDVLWWRPAAQAKWRATHAFLETHLRSC